MIVHHTVTRDPETDPKATLRAIYQYHAVSRGWGDIGYNFLIDQQGTIYEGRFGGDSVVGGHALQYNWGSIGIAILGNYSDHSITDATRASLLRADPYEGGRSRSGRQELLHRSRQCDECQRASRRHQHQLPRRCVLPAHE